MSELKRFGPFSFEPASGRLSHNGDLIVIGQRGAALLKALIEAEGGVVGKDDLIARAWPNMIVEEGNLAVQINALRKTLGGESDGADWIMTVPRVGYRLRISAEGDKAAEYASPLPSLSVLPFQNLSGDAEQEYFADGIVDELITAFSRFRSFAVISRNSTFAYKGRAFDIRHVAKELGVRYLLEGSVRRAGNRLRVVAQLVDGTTGAHLWADTFDGALADLFEVQDHITEHVVGIVAPTIESAEIERARHKPTTSLDAYDLYLRGLGKYFSVKDSENAEAFELFSRAVELDGTFAAALRGAFGTLDFRMAMGWPDLTANDAETCRTLIDRALGLGRGDATVLAYAGVCLACRLGEHRRGLELLETAVSLNPNNMAVLIAAHSAHQVIGDLDRAVEFAKRALELNPTGAGAHWPLGGLAHICMIRGEYEEALRWAERTLAANPDFDAAYWNLIAANAKLGRMDVAQHWLNKFRALRPTVTVAAIRKGFPDLLPERMAPLLDGLAAAGLAES